MHHHRSTACYQVTVRRLLVCVVAPCLVFASCISATTPSSEEVTPELLARLGLGPPDNVQWQRNIGGVDVLGLSPLPIQSELTLLGGAIEEIPQALLDAAPLRSVVRESEVSGRPIEDRTAAFTQGPDVHVVARTFAEIGSTRLGMASVLAHELAHVAQFAALDSEYANAILDGSIAVVDTAASSVLVRDFADKMGWVNRSNDLFATDWQLSAADAAGATPYGLTAPDEDMAEAVALVAMGQANLIGPERVRWVEDWLGLSAAQLANGMPYAPDGAVSVSSRAPIYDEARATSFGTAHAEPLYFQLPSDGPTTEELVGDVVAELSSRNLTGDLTRVDDPRLPRYSGLFLRNARISFWVEIWDFRFATGQVSGPPVPILTYVMLY